MRGIAVLLGATALACGAAPPETRTSEPPRVVDVVQGEDVPIVFVPFGGALVPVVTAETPEGLPLELFVDTGAGAHLLWDPAFALIGGVDDARAVTAVDPSGAQRAIFVMARPTLRLGAASLTPMVHVPMSFGHRIAGAYSPLLSAREGPVQIDLRAGRLRRGSQILPFEAGVEGALVDCGGGQVAHAHVQVVLGGVPLTLVVDTASSHTFVSRAALEGTALAERPVTGVDEVTTATGVEHVPLIGEIPVVLGEVTAVARVGLLAREDACEAGVLGLDVLAGCVIELGEGRVRLACDAASSTPPAFAPPPSRIVIEAIDLSPTCGVDATRLHALTHPATPWTFATWGEISEALGQRWLDVAPGALSEALAQVVGACREERDTEPEWALSWRNGRVGLVLVATVVGERPVGS